MNYFGIFHTNASIYLARMEKFLLGSLLLLLLPLSARASHIVGGELSYRSLGQNRYEITLRVYRDCKFANPEAYFDDPGAIGIYESNGVRFLTIGLKPIGNDTLRDGIDSCYTSVINSVCVHTTVYKSVQTLLPRAGGYRFVYQRCCRNQTIANIVNPLETGATYEILLTEEAMRKGNSSPVVNTWPPVYVCANQELNESSVATDVDGDSISYKLCAPLVGGTLARPQPLPPLGPPYQEVTWQAPTYSLANMLGGSNPLKIDAATGIMKAVPSIIGQFAVGVCVEEYDKVSKALLSTLRRDFQYNVVNCIVPQASFDAPAAVCVGSRVVLKRNGKDPSRVTWYEGESGAETLIGSGDSITLSFPSVGKRRITLYFDKGTVCQTSQSSIIEGVAVDVSTSPLAGQIALVCQGALLSIGVTNRDPLRPLTYTWNPEAILVSGQGTPNASFRINGPVTVNLDLANALGCKATLTFPAANHPSLNPGLSAGIEICRGTPSNTNPNFNPALKFSWTPTIGLSSTSIGNPQITLNTSQVYLVKVTNPATQCDTTITYTATVRPFGANPGLDSLPTVCYNQARQINNGFNPSLSYSWTPSTGLSNAEVANPVVTLKDATNFIIEVRNPSNGCDTTIRQRVEVSPQLPVVELDTAIDFCPGIPKKVSLPASTTVTYLWTPSTGLDNNQVANPTFTLRDKQSYTVKITDPRTNCNINWKIEARVSPEVVLSAGRDTVLCRYAPYTLRATSSLPVALQWSKTPDFSRVLGTVAALSDSIPRGETLYYLKGTDAKGCFWLDTVSVRSATVEATLPENYAVCRPADLTVVTVKDNDAAQGLRNFSWFPVGALTTPANVGPSATYRIAATTLANVSVENRWGCKKTMETQLELIDLKTSISADKVTLIKGNNETATITVSGCTDCTYNWTPPTGLNATNVASVRASPQDSTLYKVVVEKKGCTEEKSIRINVDNVICRDPNIFVPSAFTPNGDGVNDALKVRGRWIATLQFSVYNRWGQQMYTTTDPNASGWNGTFKTNDVAPDVYYYTLQVTCLDRKSYAKTGNTSLIR